MSIGSVLVQPQKIQRASAIDADTALLQDVLNLLTMLAGDIQAGGQVLLVMGAAFETTSRRLQEQVTHGFASAQAKLRTWISPALTRTQALSEPGVETGTPAAGLALAKQLLSLLTGLVESITLDQLRQQVSIFLDILQNDLGFTPNFIEEQIWSVIDDLIAGLEQISSGTPISERESRLGIACILRRFKRRFQAEFKFPQLDSELAARELFMLLCQLDRDNVLKQATCTLNDLSEALAAGASLAEIVPFSTNINVEPSGLPTPNAAPTPAFSRRAAVAPLADPSPPVNKSQYAWYATWLLQYKYRDIPLLKPDDLKDAQSLANKLKSPADALSRFLRDQLKEHERQAIDVYTGTGDPSDALKMTMLDLLNRLVRGEGDALAATLFDSEHFPKLDFSEATNDERSSYVRDRELLLFNRMVLEDALPNELDRLPRGFFAKLPSAFVEGIKVLFGWPGDRVAVDAAGKRVLLGEKILFTGEDVKWQQAPIFDLPTVSDGQKFYIFEHFKPETLDDWAFGSAVVADAIRLSLHLLQMQPNHRVGPILNSAYDLGHGLTSAITRKPISGFDFTGHKFLEWSLPPLFTLLGSIQGRHTEAIFKNQMAFELTVWLNDMINLIGPRSTTDTLRNALLSFMTLLNMGGPRDGSSALPANPAENYRELAGILDLSILGFTYLLVKQVRREEYVNPTPARIPDRVWALWLAGGLGMGLVAHLAGVFVAEVIAWAEDVRLLGFSTRGSDILLPFKTVGTVIAYFWVLLYSTREGDTDDGKFNPASAAFRGYPKKQRDDGTATPSPYRLPYAQDTTLFLGQGNAGMWSHNIIFNPTPAQTYAYDFGHDQGEEVLASRSGTVVNFSEMTVDNTEGTWNFIVIRHDVDDSGNPISLDPDHDRDVDGKGVVTYAVYGHGRQNGITNAFARWDTPVPTANIIGTHVKRGQPIMLAGDTGISFHNHLHMHIQAEVASLPAPDKRNTAYTIPFIFQDVDGDGVGKHGNWYTSSNTRITA